MSDYLTFDEAGRRVRHSGRTVRSWVKDGLLRAAHFGKKVLIDPRDLDAFIEQRKRGGDGNRAE